MAGSLALGLQREGRVTVARVTVSVSVDVPPGFLIFDLGVSEFVCAGCQKRQSWDWDARATRGGGGNTNTRIRTFLSEHAACVQRFLEAGRRRAAVEEATQPCRGDYWTQNPRSGPHECGKAKGHGGSCGP